MENTERTEHDISGSLSGESGLQAGSERVQRGFWLRSRLGGLHGRFGSEEDGSSSAGEVGRVWESAVGFT